MQRSSMSSYIANIGLIASILGLVCGANGWLVVSLAALLSSFQLPDHMSLNPVELTRRCLVGIMV